MPPRPTRLDLRWALGLALLLHVVALGAASHLSFARGATATDLTEAKVFDTTVQASTIPFDMVSLPVPDRVEPEAPAEPEFEPALPVPDPVTPPPAAKPPSSRQPKTPPREGKAPAAPSQPTSSPTRPSEPRPGPAGQSGAGPAALGPASSGGTIPAALPRAATPEPGTPPSGGSGGGQEAGRGAETGAAGSGAPEGGNGTGHAAEPAPASGKGHGGESAQLGEGEQASEYADRAQPKVTQKPKLVYPEDAAAEGVGGTTVLTLLVTETGAVAEVKVEKSSGDRRLDRAATGYVKRWRYLPAVQNGQPRRVYTRATVIFKPQ
jgi:TonB family protein